jgi:predicted CXXCH cytochrome family protein
MDCHDPHSQQPLFENADDLCINCHREGMGDYLNDLHVQKDIGCVDCHALVIPPEVPPEDGIVPTGHTFSISPQTCVACHTDALHAGFTLPGYENGATDAFHSQNGTADDEAGEEAEGATPLIDTSSENELNTTQQIQALETALASSRVSNLFQGAVIGLVLGGSTAWIVGANLRGSTQEEEE